MDKIEVVQWNFSNGWNSAWVFGVSNNWVLTWSWSWMSLAGWSRNWSWRLLNKLL
jgi:hypothetical protein